MCDALLCVSLCPISLVCLVLIHQPVFLMKSYFIVDRVYNSSCFVYLLFKLNLN